MGIVEQIKASDYIFGLAIDYDGHCPCAEFKLTDERGTVYAHSRCWRVSKNDQDLYVWGDHPQLKTVARSLKKELDLTKWYNPYTIIYEEWS